MSWSEIDAEEGSQSQVSDSDEESDSDNEYCKSKSNQSKVSDDPSAGECTPPPLSKRVKSQVGSSTSTPKTPNKKPLRLFKERVSDVMRQMPGRRIIAFYNGSRHKGVVLGYGPRSLYQERQWRVQFEDRKKIST